MSELFQPNLNIRPAEKYGNESFLVDDEQFLHPSGYDDPDDERGYGRSGGDAVKYEHGLPEQQEELVDYDDIIRDIENEQTILDELKSSGIELDSVEKAKKLRDCLRLVLKNSQIDGLIRASHSNQYAEEVGKRFSQQKIEKIEDYAKSNYDKQAFEIYKDLSGYGEKVTEGEDPDIARMVARAGFDRLVRYYTGSNKKNADKLKKLLGGYIH